MRAGARGNSRHDVMRCIGRILFTDIYHHGVSRKMIRFRSFNGPLGFFGSECCMCVYVCHK